MADEYERTLCQLPQCHVFKIPVRSSAAGHRASDWPQDPQWTGKVKIVAKGKTAAIFLINANDDRVFACCPVTDDAAVERCVDSGRYFVLRITNPQGKHAFIGIAFNERNDAFDFNVALSEHKASVEREEAPIQVAASLGDMSIAQGEKIKLKNITAASPRKKASGGGGAFLLAPPPVVISLPHLPHLPRSPVRPQDGSSRAPPAGRRTSTRCTAWSCSALRRWSSL